VNGPVGLNGQWNSGGRGDIPGSAATAKRSNLFLIPDMIIDWRTSVDDKVAESHDRATLVVHSVATCLPWIFTRHGRHARYGEQIPRICEEEEIRISDLHPVNAGVSPGCQGPARAYRFLLLNPMALSSELTSRRSEHPPRQGSSRTSSPCEPLCKWLRAGSERCLWTEIYSEVDCHDFCMVRLPTEIFGSTIQP
jgi:hypothetical protein